MDEVSKLVACVKDLTLSEVVEALMASSHAAAIGDPLVLAAFLKAM